MERERLSWGGKEIKVLQVLQKYLVYGRWVLELKLQLARFVC